MHISFSALVVPLLLQLPPMTEVMLALQPLLL